MEGRGGGCVSGSGVGNYPVGELGCEKTLCGSMPMVYGFAVVLRVSPLVSGPCAHCFS